MEVAYETIRDCACKGREPEVKGCYQCLYGYREQRTLHLLDRTIALELLEKLLEGFGKLTAVATVGSLSIDSVLESELEHRFRELLANWTAPGVSVTELENEQLRIDVAGRVWRYVPQVTLGEDQVLHQCRPDFVLYPEGQPASVLPVAGFADGADPHVQPRAPLGRIHDDFKKRAGIVASRDFITWSFGWKDLDVLESGDDLGSWAAGNVQRSLETLINRLGLKVGNVATADPIRALFGYLTAPEAWPGLAGCMAAAALHSGGKQATAEAVRKEVRELSTAAEPRPTLTETTPGSDNLWARLSFGVEHEAQVFLASPKNSAGVLHKSPESVQGVLRLSDTHAHRGKPLYRRSWRLFLRAYNLLQFLPNVKVVTDEQFVEADPQNVEPEPPAYDARPETSGAEVPSAIEELLRELADSAEAWVDPVRAAFRAGYDAVELPLEIREPGCSGDIELAWPEQRVGAYLDEQRHTAEYLSRQGWRLYKLEAAITSAELIESLERS